MFKVSLLTLLLLTPSCALTRAHCEGENPFVEEITIARVAETTASCSGDSPLVHTEHKKMSVTFGQTIGFIVDAALAYFGVKGVAP